MYAWFVHGRFYFAGEFIENVEQINILELEFLYDISFDILPSIERTNLMRMSVVV
jgi:hypothetical protein